MHTYITRRNTASTRTQVSGFLTRLINLRMQVMRNTWESTLQLCLISFSTKIISQHLKDLYHPWYLQPESQSHKLQPGSHFPAMGHQVSGHRKTKSNQTSRALAFGETVERLVERDQNRIRAGVFPETVLGSGFVFGIPVAMQSW